MAKTATGLTVVGLELFSDEELRAATLSNWVQLNRVLRRAPDRLVFRLFNLEVNGERPREHVVSRLYGKLAKARADRERRALLRAVADAGALDETQARDLKQLLLGLEPPT